LEREAFQAVDIVEIVKPVTKKAYCVKNPANVPWVFREAFKVMREGRPGPVLIDLPVDVQKAQIEYDPDTDSPLPIFRMQPSEKQIRKTLEMLMEAERPVMLLGGGVILADATREFLAVAEALQIPVVTTYMGKSGIPWNHPLMAGQVGTQCNTPSGNKVFLDSTTVFAVGARFNDRHTGDLEVYRGDREFIHVDVDPAQLGKNIMPDLGICADAKMTLEALLDEIEKNRVEPKPISINIPQLRTELERKTDYDDIPIKPQRVFEEINAYFDEESIWVTCIGLNQIWSAQLQQISKPRHYLDSGGAGPLGWDLPAAIGAKVARPDKNVAMVVGDYGFQFCMDALPVAVMYDIPFVCIILNNGYLGLIRQAEKYQYDMDYEVQIWYEAQGARLEKPQLQVAGFGGGSGKLPDESFNVDPGSQKRGFDFIKFAEACGATGERIFDPDQLQGAFKRGVESGAPYIIDVILERDTDASMGTAIDSIREFE
jgi:tartronate-semialdehyde synthase